LRQRRDVSVSAAEIDSALRWLQGSRATYAQVLRPARKGDAVEIDFELSSGGKEVENGSIKNHELILGEGGYLPGFEDQLIGMSAGEEKKFSLPTPRGKLDCHVKVKAVKDRKLPELNDDFSRSLGKFENLESLKTSIREGLAEEKELKERERIRILMLTKIDERTQFDLPESAIREEIKIMLSELKGALAGMGLSFETYLQQIKKTAEELEAAFRPEAERRVRYALILRQIAREAQIEPTDEEVKEAADKFLRQFSSPEKAEQAVDPDSLARYTRNVLRNEKTFEFIEKISR